MDIKQGKNYTFLNAGPVADIKNAEFNSSIIGSIKGKEFLKDKLGLSGMEVSLNYFPKNTAMPFFHKHNKNEELYLFLKGKGQFQVDDDIFDVEEGSMVRVSPQGARIWRNNSDEDFCFVVIQARENTMLESDISDGSLVEREIKWPEETLVS